MCREPGQAPWWATRAVDFTRDRVLQCAACFRGGGACAARRDPAVWVRASRPARPLARSHARPLRPSPFSGTRVHARRRVPDVRHPPWVSLAGRGPSRHRLRAGECCRICSSRGPLHGPQPAAGGSAYVISDLPQARVHHTVPIVIPYSCSEFETAADVCNGETGSRG